MYKLNSCDVFVYSAARNKKLTPHSFQFGSWSFIQKWQTIEKLCVYSCPAVWIQHYEKCSLFNGKV